MKYELKIFKSKMYNKKIQCYINKNKIAGNQQFN